MLRKVKKRRDSGTRSRVSKKPWECKAYRDYVAAKPCLVCSGPAHDAHHIRECFPRTMGRQISDAYVVPLCRAHHTYLHRHSKTFWADVEVTPRHWCDETYIAWESSPQGRAAIAGLREGRDE